MAALKVLFINRPKAWWVGGDYVQMEKTAEALRSLGVDVTISETPAPVPAITMRQYDIVHLWNFSMQWSKIGLYIGKGWGKKVVASMIYHDAPNFVSFEHQQIMLDNLDKAIFLCEGEVERLKRKLTIKEDIIEIIPNGIEPWWFDVKKPKQKDYVLTVGRLDGTKGQYETAVACKELGISYVCIGEKNDKDYASIVEAAGVTIIDPLSHKDLAKKYAECRLFVLASDAELFPLTVMEAGTQGKNIVLTNKSEWQDIPNVELCTPRNVESIKQAITKALEKPENTAFVEQLKKTTWHNVGEKVLSVYNTL